MHVNGQNAKCIAASAPYTSHLNHRRQAHKRHTKYEFIFFFSEYLIAFRHFFN